MTMRNRELSPEEVPPQVAPVDAGPPAEITGMPVLSPPPNNRLTVVETVYHQTFGEQPVSVESRFERELQSDEQMYQRRKIATEEWQPLDLGWVEEVGCVVAQNTEGQFLQLIPTPEQRAENAKKILEVAYLPAAGMVFYVPPGESLRLYPSHPKQLVIRCQAGTVKYTVNIIPA